MEKEKRKEANYNHWIHWLLTFNYRYPNRRTSINSTGAWTEYVRLPNKED